MENPFVYATDPELNVAFDQLVRLKKRTADTLEKATKMAGIGDSQGFVQLNPCPIHLPEYNIKRNPYSSYAPKASLASIDEEVRQAIKQAEAKIEEISALNAPLIAQNAQLKNDIITLMTRLGITPSYQTYEYPTSRSRTKKSVNHSAGYTQDLARCMPSDPCSTAKYTLSTYVQNYERWLKAEQEKEIKEKIAKDEDTIRVHVMGNPEMMGLLMTHGVNVLDVMHKALVGKKIDAIKYSAVAAIESIKASANPDLDAIEKIYNWHKRL